MKTNPLLSLRSVRALARELAAALAREPGDTASPGASFFPKRTHELSPIEDDAPDGLSAAYIELAALLNRDLRKVDAEADDGLVRLLFEAVETEIARARIEEAQIIERLEADR